jgi:hypothetical protein
MILNDLKRLIQFVFKGFALKRKAFFTPGSKRVTGAA